MMKRTSRNVLIAAGSVLAGITAVSTISYSITKKLVKTAIERDGMPEKQNTTKARERIRGSERSSLFVQELNACEERLREKPMDLIEINSSDGLKLIGHWYPCESPERIIIAMHGWRSSWSWDFGSIADFWHENNCSVLFAEQRAQGESDGDYIGFGLTERFDCLQWVHRVNQMNEQQLPIYLAGVSMGAATVLMASNLGMPSNVHGIVADCGFTSPHEIWKHVVENNLHVPYSLHSKAADYFFRQNVNMSTHDFSTVDAMKENHIPVLFVHGTEDKFVPIEMTYENYKACAAPKHLLVVPGADHGMSYFTEQDRYENAIRKFWMDYDFYEPFGFDAITE